MENQIDNSINHQIDGSSDNFYDCIIESNKNYIDIESFEMELIPDNISISTMSLACCLGVAFDTINIYKYMILDLNDVIAIKSPTGLRCIKGYETQFKSTEKNSKKNFYNQNTIIIRASDESFLNVKLFKNGSIQMTGCKNLHHANIVLNKLMRKLSESVYIKNSDGLLKEIKFVNNSNNLTVKNFKIDLINSNFGINYLINKEKLFELLKSNHILCRLSPIHSCVNIKFKINLNEIEQISSKKSYVSIFVFQTGNIIITGAKKAIHVRSAYRFIVKFLNTFKKDIIKRDISTLITSDDIISIVNQINNV